MSDDAILGAIRVHPAALRSLVALTASEVPGVVRVGHRHRGRPNRPGAVPQGARVRVDGLEVIADIDLTVDSAMDLVTVGRNVQRSVTEAIGSLVGLSVREVNVRIQDVV